MLRSLACLLCVAAAFGYAGRASAQYDQFVSPSDQQFLDSAYDYELWVADPDTATAWYVILEYPDGYVDVRGPHATREDAVKWYNWTTWHTVSLIRNGKGPSVRYEERSKEPYWQYYETYPTLAAAEDAAEWFEDFGMLVDIRRVSTLRQPFMRLW